MRHSWERLFRDKPECMICFKDDPQASAGLERLAGRPGLAIVELAGRDSVAAALAAAGQGGLDVLLPTYVYTGSEYGPFSWVEEALKRLAARLPAGIELLPPLVFGSPAFWRALNGRLLGELNRRYGFSTVCLGCHLYLHAARVPLARALGQDGKGAPIISGERESHDGKLKLNQAAPALEAYVALCAEFGVELMLPLRREASGRRIQEILGLAWPEGGEQLGCVLSGNYRDLAGGAPYDAAAFGAYLHEFALPVTRKVVAAYLAGNEPAHLDIALEVMGRLKP